MSSSPGVGAPTGPGQTDDAPQPWEQQAWDTPASYKAFKDFYLREEPGNGRLIRAYRKYGRDKGVKKAPQKVPGTWSAWANGRQPSSGKPIPGARTWADRAAAYDAHVAAEELKELAKQRVASKKARIRASEGALAHLTIALSQYDFKPKVVNGRIVPPDLPDFKDAVRAMATVFDELRKDYDDLPRQRLEHTGKDGEKLEPGMPVNVYNLSGLSDEEIIDRLQELDTRRAGGASGAASGDGAPAKSDSAPAAAGSQEADDGDSNGRR
jgi:hypothetical protein